MMILQGERARAACVSAPAPACVSGKIFDDERPDDTFAVLGDDGVLLARASVWWREAPPVEGKTGGVTGHYFAVSEEASRLVLDAACSRLAEAACDIVHGPMDGNTWRRYRLVVDGDGSPPFLLEPANPPEWPAWWEAAGFSVAAGYSSSSVPLPAPEDPRTLAAEERLAAAGVRIRTLDATRFDDELRAAYRLTVKAFAGAHLYTPLPEEDFLRRYRALGPVLRPEFVLLAEREGELAGYLFGIPDAAETARTGSTTTLVGKTIAVAPGRGFAGLGAVMLGRLYAIAHAAGFRRMIHALQYDGNAPSRNLGGPSAHTIRRYALYSRNLSGGRV